MAALTHQSIGFTGVNVTFTAVAGIDTAQTGDRAFLWVKNGGGGSTTVTVAVPGQTFLQNNPDVAVSIPAGQERMIGPLTAEIADPGNPSAVVFTTSPTTSVTAAAVELPIPSGDLQ